VKHAALRLLSNLDGVLNENQSALTPTPDPSPCGEGSGVAVSRHTDSGLWLKSAVVIQSGTITKAATP
jgi:hypothetical protein